MAIPELSFDPAHPIVPLEGKPENFKLSEEEQIRLSFLPLEGRTAPQTDAGEKKKAIILWGPPGSGKTTQGHEWLAQHEDPSKFVTVCYDERGALHSIAAYTEKNDALVRQHDAILASQPPTKEADLKEVFDKRLALYQQYRDDSQRIRAYTLNEAITQGDNVFIDTTSSGKRAGYLMDTLKREGYDIEMVGRLASAEIAETRINGRGIKAIDPDDAFNKRVGCYELLPVLMQKADKSSLYLNDVQNASPVLAIDTRDGQVFFTSQEAKDALADIATRDAASFAAHPNPTARGQTEALRTAVANMETALDALPVSNIVDDEV